jgi:cytosine/adenosine deaminase-related metal-dependent hydrolase
MIVVAAQVLFDGEHYADGGGILVRRGRIARCVASRRALERHGRASGERVLDLGDGLLAPGTVNAHAHLELAGLGGAPEPAFASWVRAMIATRRSAREARYRAAARDGLARLLGSGTTTVGDFAASRASLVECGPLPMRLVLFREILDAWDPARSSTALAGVARRLPRRRRVVEGLAPHAPYTASAALLAAARRIASARRAPVSIHWSETEEELAWMEHGAGPLAALLPSSPRRSGLDLIAEAGLLRRGLQLVHGNHPRRGEPQRIARAGASLVHCPGTHAFFGRSPFPWRAYLDAGVRVALGTDSLASNAELDMGREMALARSSAPWLAPARVWRMATSDAAWSLGLAGETGRLAPGLAADFVHLELDGRGRDAVLESLTSGAARARGTWIGGRRVELPRGPSFENSPYERPAAPGRHRGQRRPRGHRVRRGVPVD